MFMSTAPLTAEPDATPGPQDRGGDRRGRLLGLVRKIMDYGRDLVASLQRQNTPAPNTNVARSFGTFNLALIIARITRGLALAARLESRLMRASPTRAVPPAGADRPDGPAPVRIVRPKASQGASEGASQRASRPAERSEAEDDAALLRGPPSAEDIAARVRNRPAGAVIVEICRDLGIDAAHPLWPDIRDAIIAFDGSLARMLRIWLARIPGFLAGLPDTCQALPPSSVWDGPLAASTGPP